MTIEEIEITVNLFSRVSYIPGSWDKRFVRDIYHECREKELTQSQKEWLYRILYKYRRQVPKTFEAYKNHPDCSRKPDRAQKVVTRPEPKTRVSASFQLKLNM